MWLSDKCLIIRVQTSKPIQYGKWKMKAKQSRMSHVLFFGFGIPKMSSDSWIFFFFSWSSQENTLRRLLPEEGAKCLYFLWRVSSDCSSISSWEQGFNHILPCREARVLQSNYFLCWNSLFKGMRLSRPPEMVKLDMSLFSSLWGLFLQAGTLEMSFRNEYWCSDAVFWYATLCFLKPLSPARW